MATNVVFEMTNQQVIDLIKDVNWSEPEKVEILKVLIGGRGYLDKKALVSEVTELIYSTF